MRCNKRLISIMRSGDKTEFINRLKTPDLINRNGRRDHIQMPMDEVPTGEVASQQQTLAVAEGPLQDMTEKCKRTCDSSRPMRSPLRTADSSSDTSSNHRRSSRPRRARSSRSVGLTLSTMSRVCGEKCSQTVVLLCCLQLVRAPQR